MLERKIQGKIRKFFRENRRKALLVTGARQVGKTYIIRNFGRQNYAHFAEINFLENKTAADLFANASDSKDLLLRISAMTEEQLVPGETLIFFDEVQECKELVTAIKFLVEEGSYRYILSGSLLGVDLQDIRSVPVGYMDVIEMYPLDLEEFAHALKVSDAVITSLRESFRQRCPVDSLVHRKMMEVFRLYLIVGGMPAVVTRYLETNNLRDVAEEQHSIIHLYKKDIAKYDPEDKLYLEEIFERIPSELNSHNKRFILKSLNQNFKFSRYENSFLWLKNAGVALPVYSTQAPVSPLVLSRATNLFKLFLCDVGLLAAMYMDGIQIRILNNEMDINFGSVYENAAAQELKAHGFPLYYFNSKKQGELDFVVECNGNILPIEIKSEKAYKRHTALNNVLSNPLYDIPEGYVFYNENIFTEGKVTYFPIYMLMFLEHEVPPEEMIYKIDLGVLQNNPTSEVTP